ncbi:MAG: metal-dependent transcriptional regulator [Anaerolineales bacterium]
MDRPGSEVQDYLKTIYLLRQREGRATTSAIAQALSVTPASVTGMVKRLAGRGLVRHVPYQGVALTGSGERIALEVVRHHRILELFLMESLGYSWDEVHEEADRLEHVISEDFEDRMARRLGHPAVDPHGDPIPAKGGRLPSVPERRLSELPVGRRARIVRVNDTDPALLRFAASLGLRPRARVTLLEAEPFGGSLRVRVGGVDRSVGRALADQVFVTASG